MRQDIAHLFTFFLPGEVKLLRGGSACTGGLNYSFASDTLSFYVDYDGEAELSAPEGAWGAAEEVTVAGQRVKLSTFKRDELLPMGWANMGVVALFPDVPPCPQAMCFGSKKPAMLVTAYCKGKPAEEIALAAIRSMRRW